MAEVPPAYKWGGAPAGAGLPSARERAAWEQGRRVAFQSSPEVVALLLRTLAGLRPEAPAEADAYRRLGAADWALAFLAGLAQGVELHRGG